MSTDVFNPKTGNYVKSTTKLGQALTYIQSINDPALITNMLSKCKSQQVYHPITRKCVKATTSDAQSILAAYEYYLVNRQEDVPAAKIKKSKGNTCANYPPKTKPFIPRKHQVDTLNFFIEHFGITRGILLYWGLGSGKSCGAAELVDYILSLGEDRDVYILTSASTRENFKNEYCSICGDNPEELERFKFVSYNYSMLSEKIIDVFDLSTINNAVFVIDEFHNFISGYINGSVNYTKLYELFMSATNAKFILMTGTPLLDRIKELFVILNLLLPNKFTDYDDFYKRFTFNDLNQLIPPDDLKRELKLVISRYAPSPEGYPTIKNVKLVVPLSNYQYDRYVVERSAETSVAKPDEKLKVINLKAYNNQKTKYFLAKIMLRSQAICNCAYPAYAENKEDMLQEDGGWVDDNFISNLLVYSPKIFVLVNMIFKYPGKHIVFTRYVKKSGVYLISAVLKYFNIKHLIFSGETNSDEKRQEIINNFNSENNLNGEIYPVLIFTEAGSEGLNIFQVRFFYAFEQYIRTYLLKQAEGRGIRFGSHNLLPENMRDITIVNLFAATPGPNVEFESVDETRKTSDFYAYEQAIAKQFRIQPVIDMMSNL